MLRDIEIRRGPETKSESDQERKNDAPCAASSRFMLPIDRHYRRSIAKSREAAHLQLMQNEQRV